MTTSSPASAAQKSRAPRSARPRGPAAPTSIRLDSRRTPAPIALGIDQDPRDTGEVVERSQVCVAATVDHIDGVRGRVRDVQATTGRIEVRVRVIEARALAAGQRHEADGSQAHAGLASTFFWQYA